MSRILFKSVLEQEEHEPIQTLVRNKIRRKLKERKIYSVNEKKEYKFSYFKNKITKNFTSEPWGF